MAKAAAKRTASRSRGEDSADSATVRTVVVAGKVLDALAEFRGPVRLIDLARSLKMTLPRISRHVATLRQLGFIEKVELGEAYRLGAKLFVLGQIALEQNALAHVAQSHLARLRDQLHRTVLLSSPAGEGDDATVLLCVASHDSPTIVVRPGSLLEFPISPSARILHAFNGEIGSSRPKSTNLYVEERVEFIRANYYDFEPDARGTGIGSLAAPVFDHEDRLAGVVAVVMPSNALSGGADANMVKAVTEAAARISTAMGSRGWSERIAPAIASGRGRRG